MCSAWQVLFCNWPLCHCAQSCPTLWGTTDRSPPGSPGRNSGVGCHLLLQGSNPCLLCLLHWQMDSLPPSHLGSPPFCNWGEQHFQTLALIWEVLSTINMNKQKQDMHVCVLTCWFMPNSLQRHGLWPARLLCPWDSPDKNTGVGCHALLRGSFWPRD